VRETRHNRETLLVGCAMLCVVFCVLMGNPPHHHEHHRRHRRCWGGRTQSSFSTADRWAPTWSLCCKTACRYRALPLAVRGCAWVCVGVYGSITSGAHTQRLDVGLLGNNQTFRV